MQDPESGRRPLFVGSEADGSTGYVAMMYVRCRNSDIETLEDMEGRKPRL